MLATTVENYLNNLSVSDRKALQVLVIFMLVLVLIWGIIKPSYNYYNEAKQSLIAEQQLLGWIKAHATQFKQTILRPSTKKTASKSLLQTASDTANDTGLKIERVQPEGEHNLRVWLNAVDFAKAITWIDALVTQKQVMVQQISIEKTPKSGLVSIQVQFRRLSS